MRHIEILHPLAYTKKFLASPRGNTGQRAVLLHRTNAWCLVSDQAMKSGVEDIKR
jgi:hypothetical protein